jgi:YfiH family protein
VVSLKQAGNMSLNHLEQRKGFLQSLGIEPDRAYFLKQIHSKRVILLDEKRTAFEGIWEGILPKGDGLLTQDRRAVLCVGVADCLPIFLFDRYSGAFGLLHSGWKGTGIVEVGVKLMQERFHADPGKLKLLLGPCIGPCCYRVPRDRFELFESQFGADSVKKTKDGYYIDLKAANLLLLARLGVEDIIVVPDCTSCNPLLASFRRDGKGFSGMLAVTGFF